MSMRSVGTLLALLSIINIGVALAEASVEGRLHAYIVSTDERGDETVRSAVVAGPGELMEYRLTFVNNGEGAVDGLSVVDSIPANTTFVSGSATSDARAIFEVSVDGGKSFEPEPVTRIETGADGSRRTLVISPERYTHLRWSVEDALAGGAEQRYAYRVTVD